MDNSELKTLLTSRSPEFWEQLAARTREARGPDELLLLSALRKKGCAKGVPRPGAALQDVRLAITGGCSFYPFHELLGHLCEMEGIHCKMWIGEYDNYISEIMEESSGLYDSKPQIVLVMPAEHRYGYSGKLSDLREMQQAEASQVVNSLLQLTAKAHDRTGANVIITNFILPARHDPGAYRTRTLGSDWSFRKWVNLELGLNAPPYLHICDLEFLAHRRGGTDSRDERAWFESKQPCSPALLADLAREVAHLIQSLRRAPRKVLALDLDNTLWGGVVADDGLEGIEIGDTSPRGEAFKAFQKYILTLKHRGVLLAVCSKNDHALAAEAFESHPEMVLKMSDFVSFKANWEPKSENLRQMAAELNLGLDSFVFADDNPAEIEIVRQFAPEVATILLGPDVSDFVGQLQDCRFFEPRSLTAEDLARTNQYHAEEQRKALFASITDMGAYLESLEMEAVISEFTALDAPRLSQLINKSNQFNLTTRRRSEAEVSALIRDPAHVCFSVRLKDRFGDHGLISIVIAQKNASVMDIDTWLMSCRVLKRQVEDEVLNELARLAKERGCELLHGVYLPTVKNAMVRDFYARMGFTLTREDQNERCFALELKNFEPTPTKIKIVRRAYEPD